MERVLVVISRLQTPAPLPSKFRQRLKIVSRVSRAFLHFMIFPLSPPGTFHSETSASFRCSSDKQRRILQHHLGQPPPKRLSPIQGAHTREQRLDTGNTSAKTHTHTHAQKERNRSLRCCRSSFSSSSSADNSDP